MTDCNLPKIISRCVADKPTYDDPGTRFIQKMNAVRFAATREWRTLWAKLMVIGWRAGVGFRRIRPGSARP